MENKELAEELIQRLNTLAVSGGRGCLETLISTRVPVDLDPDHPTIQCSLSEDGNVVAGFLGVLNGVVGVFPDGPKKGWGYIAARFECDEDGLPKQLLGFDLIENK